MAPIQSKVILLLFAPVLLLPLKATWLLPHPLQAIWPLSHPLYLSRLLLHHLLWNYANESQWPLTRKISNLKLLRFYFKIYTSTWLQKLNVCWTTLTVVGQSVLVESLLGGRGSDSVQSYSAPFCPGPSASANRNLVNSYRFILIGSCRFQSYSVKTSAPRSRRASVPWTLFISFIKYLVTFNLLFFFVFCFDFLEAFFRPRVPASSPLLSTW